MHGALPTARPSPFPLRRAAGSCVPLVAAVLLGACSLGPHYHRPDVPPPAHWVTAPDTATQWPSSDWWRGFESADLDSFIEQARLANDDLRAAVARVHQADAQRRIAGAPLLPQVGGQASATRSRGLVTGE